MQTRLILIRHGETDWNAQKRYMGSTDIELNERGMAQARALKLKLRGQAVSAVYSSSARRAMRFAECVFEGRAIETMPDLREMGFGIFEGMRYDEITERYPELYRAWVDDPFAIDIPDGESAGRFHQRILEAFRSIETRCEGRVSAVVTHGGPIGIFLSNVLGLKDIWAAMPETDDVRIVEREKGGIWAMSRLS